MNIVKQVIKAAACVLIATTLGMGLTSCERSVGELKDMIHDGGRKAGTELEGTWYSGYGVTGTAEIHQGDETKVIRYTYVMDVYRLEQGGHGYWSRFLFADVNDMPIALQGGPSKGTFTYLACGGNGNIATYRESTTTESWSFEYDGKTLKAKGINHRDCTFTKASASMSEMFDNWNVVLK